MNCHAELDPLESASLLSAAERVVRDETARAVDEKLLPLAAGAFEKGEMPEAAVLALAEMGAFGASMDRGPMQYGLIAEEVAEVYPDLVAHSADGQIETVKYQVLDAMLLNELQQQQAQIRALVRQNDDLQRRLAALESALAARR